ncbi:MAG: hydantoinase B/oxoprolinase family protein [Pseudomonadota bacterium]
MARAHTCQRIIDVVFGALADAAPEQSLGASNGANTTLVFSGVDPRSGEAYVYLETLGPKWATVWNPHTLRRTRIARPIWDRMAVKGRRLRKPRNLRRSVPAFIRTTELALTPGIKRRVRTMLRTP